MKSFATLLGWIAIGAVVTIAGQYAWRQFSAKNPEQSQQVAEQVKKTVHSGAEQVKQTADTVARKTAEEPAEDPDATVGNSLTSNTETLSTAPKQAAVETATLPVVPQPTVEPTLGDATPLDPVADTRTEDEIREDAITNRFYKLAAGGGEPTLVQKPAKTESAADYETRQNQVKRQEDILMDRQMRIVGELSGE